MTWHLVDGLKVALGVPDNLSLPQPVRRSLALLARFGVRVFQSDSRWDEHGVPAAVQIDCKDMCQTLFASDKALMTPGEHWLVSTGTSIWISSNTIAPLVGTPVATEGWDAVEAGAKVLEITTQLNGPVIKLEERLAALLAVQHPEFTQLVNNDQAVSVHYSDRYLKSPWSLMVLESAR